MKWTVDIWLVAGKLSGMHENTAKVAIEQDASDAKYFATRVLTVANMLQVPSSDEKTHRFSAHTLASGTLVLVEVAATDSSAKIIVNCEKMVIGTMLLKDIKTAFSS